MSEPPGRPRAYTEQTEPLSTATIRWTAWHKRNARKLGDGNVSDGVRYAIEQTVAQQGGSGQPKRNKE